MTLTDEQEGFLHLLYDNLGIVTTTLEQTGITRETYDEWCENIFFSRRVHEVDQSSIDYVEDQLLKQITKGNVSAITFYLKTKGKDRGYV